MQMDESHRHRLRQDDAGVQGGGGRQGPAKGREVVRSWVGSFAEVRGERVAGDVTRVAKVVGQAKRL